MKFDTKNDGTWFWFGDDEKNGGVCLRVCAGEDVRRLERLTTKPGKEYKRGNRYEYKIVDNKKYDELLWDFCVVDWRKVDIDGKVNVECTRENKMILMSKSVEFASFVGRCMETLGDTENAEEEAEEKNLPSSQNG